MNPKTRRIPLWLRRISEAVKTMSLVSTNSWYSIVLYCLDIILNIWKKKRVSYSFPTVLELCLPWKGLFTTGIVSQTRNTVHYSLPYQTRRLLLFTWLKMFMTMWQLKTLKRFCRNLPLCNLIRIKMIKMVLKPTHRKFQILKVKYHKFRPGQKK